MKTITAAIVVLCVSAAHAQAQPDPGSWFKTRNVAEGVWCIDDHGNDNVYLVVGKEKALLVDTGIGTGKLMEFVKTLTRLPLVVVNTHGHGDHAGGNYEFKSVYAHPLEFDAIRQSVRGNRPAAELLPVTEGQVFDLGRRKVEVIVTPGHTPGEIVLLDSANRIVFTGDNDNGLVWLFLPTCMPLEVYLESLKKLQRRSGDFDTILPGHGTPLPAAFVADQIGCVERILDGSCKGSPYKSFAGDALLCRYGTASVAFNPKNLRANR